MKPIPNQAFTIGKESLAYRGVIIWIGILPLEEFAPVSLTSSPASHSACDSGAIQTGEIRIEFPGGIIAHFSGMAESQAAMQLLTQLCNRHVLPE